MDSAELVATAQTLLSVYSELLLVDPFCRVKLEVAEGDFVSACEADKAPLTWVLKLNPVRHADATDVQYSVLEALLKVVFYPLEVADASKAEEARRGVISRLTTALAGLLPLSDEPEGGPNVEPS